MSEVLLRELSNADVDWMVSVGEQQHFAQGTAILNAYERPESLYILLDGAIAITGVNQNGQATTLTHVPQGGVFGIATLLDAPLPLAFRAEADCRVLAISHDLLADKIRKDTAFSGHFYRAIALILSERLRTIYASPDQLRFSDKQPMKEAMVVFGELRDSDVDWLMSIGRIQQFGAEDFLVQAGRPVESLYIILSGQFSVAVFEGDCNPFSVCFDCPVQTASTMDVVTYLSKGSMAGTIAFIDFRPNLFTIRAVNDAMALCIPRPQLTIKLLQDLGFAARFHRVVSLQLLALLDTSIAHLGLNASSDTGETIDEGVLGDEINLEGLHQVSQGSARFTWMLQQLGVSG